MEIAYTGNMRVIGIDPGLATVGLGVVHSTSPQDITAEQWLTIETPAGMPLHNRLEEIEQDLSAFLEETKPDLAVVERLFFAVNEKTAIDVAQARGVILLCLAKRNIRIIEPTPLQLKQCITGYGQADKAQVTDMLVRMFSLPHPPKPDDAADALGLAAYGAIAGAMLTLTQG